MAIDVENTKNFLFNKKQKPVSPQTSIDNENKDSIVKEKSNNEKGPKYKNLHQVTVLMDIQKKQALDMLTTQISFKRKNNKLQDKEPITTNSLIRVAIDILLTKISDNEIPILANEKELLQWIKSCI